ncbi:MAG TPA: hypothetical protein VD995_20850 [Azospirillum sp.]|nr:hypothetical protein [Azospirillum sp.]
MDMPDGLKGLLTCLLDRIEAVADARLDEQRQAINALIPMRIAAVPPAAE